MAKDRSDITTNVSKDTCEANRKMHDLAIKNVGDKVSVMSQNLGTKIEDLGKHIRGNGKAGALERIRNIKDDIDSIKTKQEEDSTKLDALVSLRNRIEIYCKVIKYAIIGAMAAGILFAGGEIFNVKLFDKDITDPIKIEKPVDSESISIKIEGDGPVSIKAKE